MGKNDNAKCVICGKGYHLCMSCKEKLAIAPYKTLTDTAEHYKVHQVLNGYRCGVYTKEEANKALSNVDLSDRETYIEAVKKLLDEIMPVEVKVEKMVVAEQNKTVAEPEKVVAKKVKINGSVAMPKTQVAFDTNNNFSNKHKNINNKIK